MKIVFKSGPGIAAVLADDQPQPAAVMIRPFFRIDFN
jgi:hypothetical protein